jgi:hypothetical protein
MSRVRSPHGGLEAGGDLAQHAQGLRHQSGGRGPLGQGVAGAGAGLDGVGLLAAEQGGAVVLVALGIAEGDADAGVGEGASLRAGGGVELGQEADEVVGVLAGGVEADGEVDGGMGGGEAGEAFAEQGVPLGGLGEGEVGGGGLEVVTEESGVVAVARGVDADAEARRGAGIVQVHGRFSETEGRDKGDARSFGSAVPRGSL